MNKENGTFTITNSKGEEIKCNILFTFENDKNNKNYIVFTDNTQDDDGNTKVYANVYEPNGDDINLLTIDTKEEWELIENLLADLQKKIGEELEEN